MSVTRQENSTRVGLYNMTTDWKEYYKKIGNGRPRPLLVEALKKCDGHLTALDIGAGSMADSIYLLQENFNKVIAIDSSKSFLEITREIRHPHLEIYNIPIENFDFSKEKFNLINAQFSLPFVGKESFGKVWRDIETSLTLGGIFCGQLFGVRDTWNTQDSSLIFQTKEEVLELINQVFEVISYEEMESDGRTASGEKKHWHIFNFIVKK